MSDKVTSETVVSETSSKTVTANAAITNWFRVPTCRAPIARRTPIPRAGAGHRLGRGIRPSRDDAAPGDAS